MRGCIIGILLVIFVAGFCDSGVAGENAYIPSSSPVTMRPLAEDESRLGYGFDTFTMTDRWEEDLITSTVEDIGDIEYSVNNFILGYFRNRSGVSSWEVDLLVGTVSAESKVDSYFSESLGREVAVHHEADGTDIGMRAMYSRNLFQNAAGTKDSRVEWTLSMGFHASWFSLDAEYEGMSMDQQFGQMYTETDEGIFFRPVIVMQPRIRLSDRFSLSPFVGADAKLALVTYDLQVQSAVWEGRQVNLNFPTRDGWDWTMKETELRVMDKRFFAGFDVGFIVNKDARHEISLGAVLSKVTGDVDANFTEAHVLYSMPF